MLKLTNKKGFTLIESAVALAILIIGILAMIRFFPFALQIIGDSQNKTLAANIAMEKIEMLTAESYDTIATGIIESRQKVSSDPNNYAFNFERQTNIELLDNNHQPTVTDQGIKKLTVTVYWRGALLQNEQEFSIETIITNF